MQYSLPRVMMYLSRTQIIFCDNFYKLVNDPPIDSHRITIRVPQNVCATVISKIQFLVLFLFFWEIKKILKIS